MPGIADDVVITNRENAGRAVACVSESGYAAANALVG
jgi:hypothetical protein